MSASSVIRPHVAPYTALGTTNWAAWLADFEANLHASGYRRYRQLFKKADFAWWKSFGTARQRLYQVGVLFYDFRLFNHRNADLDRIGIEYVCLLCGTNERVELMSGQGMDIPGFEAMAKAFYQAVQPFTMPRRLPARRPAGRANGAPEKQRP